MKVNLPYGRKNIELEIPQDKLQIITPKAPSLRKKKTTKDTKV